MKPIRLDSTPEYQTRFGLVGSRSTRRTPVSANMSGYSVQTPLDQAARACRPGEAWSRSVVLEVWFLEIGTGIFACWRKFRHVQCLNSRPGAAHLHVQTQPQIAIPVRAELAGDRIFHAERKLIELAGRAVDAHDLVEDILHDPNVTVAVDGHPDRARFMPHISSSKIPHPR